MMQEELSSSREACLEVTRLGLDLVGLLTRSLL